MERSGGLVRTKGIASDVECGSASAVLAAMVTAGAVHALISWHTAAGIVVSHDPSPPRGARDSCSRSCDIAIAIAIAVIGEPVPARAAISSVDGIAHAALAPDSTSCATKAARSAMAIRGRRTARSGSRDCAYRSR